MEIDIKGSTLIINFPKRTAIEDFCVIGVLDEYYGSSVRAVIIPSLISSNSFKNIKINSYSFSNLIEFYYFPSQYE